MFSTKEEEEKLSSTAERFCRRFSLAEIQSATEDFSEAYLIGHGGFGKVYKGQIDNVKEFVAIKRLALNSNQGEGEFLTEIETLSKLRHVNLVSLIGYCNENGEMILVYEYIPRGTLADHLYRLSSSKESDDFSSLTWKQCLNLCIGAGRGLDYLHTGSSIIHRDVKSTNILVDENFTAKVSDFGLAKHLSASSSKSYVSTMVKGTFGYLDPSYFITSRLTQKSDTYAFGVVLLEVLCGRPPVDPRLGEDEMSLVTWAQEKISKRKVDQIVASYLRKEISADCLKTFVGVMKRCLHQLPEKRPTMGEAVIQLQLALKQQEIKAPTPKASRFPLFNAFWKRVKPPGKIRLPLYACTNLFNAFKQQEIKAPTPKASRFPLFNAFWRRVKPPAGSRASGSLQKNHSQVDINTLPTAAPVNQEDASKVKQTVIMLPSVESEDKPTVNVLPSAAVPAIPILELIGITKNFSAECLIGEGSNGSVYRGFRNGQATAIKMLNRSSLLEQEFLAQVSIASSLKHENVVQLLGYCVDGGRQFLSYEFAQGSIHDFLHNTGILRKAGVKGSHKHLWSQRVKFAVGAAKGLEYIHEKGHIHRNIKSRNVLLFDNGEVAKIADINLASRRGSSTVPMFCGYDAPECAMMGQSRKSDVYCFGVVLLELLTGREPVGYPWLDMDLVTWARPKLLKNKVKEVVDARLKRDYPQSAITTMAEIASRCVQDEPRDRPGMSDVVKALQPLLDSSNEKTK